MRKIAISFFCILNGVICADNITLTRPQIAMNSSGDAVVEWAQYNGVNFAIYESTLVKGGDWADPIQLSPDNRDAIYHQLAMNEEGDVFFIWQYYNGSFFEIQVASSDFGGTPSDPVTISTRPSFFPKIAVNNDGKGVAVWQDTFPAGKILSSSRETADGWIQPIQLDGHGGYFIVSSIANQPGTSNAVAVWQMNIDKDTIGISAAKFDGTSWSGLTLLSSADRDAINPQVVYSSSGEAVAVWQTSFQGKLALQVASYINGGWQTPATICDGEANLIDPQLAINSSGQVVIVGRRLTETQSLIIALVRNANQWEQCTVISDDGSCKNPQVDLNDDGQAVAVWSCKSGTRNAIQAATLEIGNSWNTPTDIVSTDNNLNPQVAIDDTGYAIATWQSTVNSNTHVKASILPTFGGNWGPAEVINPTPLF